MGEPTGRNGPVPLPESIGQEEGTRGTETSKYPQEKKEKIDSLSSGERTGKSPNHFSSEEWGCRDAEKATLRSS